MTEYMIIYIVGVLLLIALLSAIIYALCIRRVKNISGVTEINFTPNDIGFRTGLHYVIRTKNFEGNERLRVLSLADKKKDKRHEHPKTDTVEELPATETFEAFQTLVPPTEMVIAETVPIVEIFVSSPKESVKVETVSPPEIAPTLKDCENVSPPIIQIFLSPQSYNLSPPDYEITVSPPSSIVTNVRTIDINRKHEFSDFLLRDTNSHKCPNKKSSFFKMTLFRIF